MSATTTIWGGHVGRFAATLPGKLRRAFLGIAPREVTLARRGFRGSSLDAGQRLERVGACFLHGYHAALESGSLDPLPPQLEVVGREDLGFAYEGAAMGLSVLDRLSLPYRAGGRAAAFLAGACGAHAYLVHVGIGWAAARFRTRWDRLLAGLDPLLGWLTVDGYGFHEGYFHPRRAVRRGAVPAALTGYARRAFDQGLGRSLWFVEGADVTLVTQTVAGFDPARRPDLWSGVGLAAAYAGGAGPRALAALRDAAAPYGPAVAQGAAFAAKARLRAGTPADHTEEACQALCDLTAGEAAAVTDAALLDLPTAGPLPTFEVWRRRVQCRFS